MTSYGPRTPFRPAAVAVKKRLAVSWLQRLPAAGGETAQERTAFGVSAAGAAPECVVGTPWQPYSLKIVQ